MIYNKMFVKLLTQIFIGLEIIYHYNMLLSTFSLMILLLFLAISLIISLLLTTTAPKPTSESGQGIHFCSPERPSGIIHDGWQPLSLCPRYVACPELVPKVRSRMDPWLNIIEFSESSVCSAAKKSVKSVKLVPKVSVV